MENLEEASLSDRLENLKLIARGSHSDVHEVFIEGTEERRVAKTIRLPIQLGESKPEVFEKLEKAFENGKQLCKLRHENIMRFFDMEIKKSNVVIFMEMIDGETLEKFISSHSMDDGMISDLARQICSAMHYIHTLKPRAIVHRDINCRTIMVSEDRVVKLIDFGLAVQLVESATDHITGNPKGDPWFMAPELFLSDETDDTPYSCASDIWAFGCVIYQMVTGNRPHGDCKNMLAIVRRVNKQGAPKLPDHCSDVLKDFYASCTAKHRCNRKSAEQLLQHPFLNARAIMGPTEASNNPEVQNVAVNCTTDGVPQDAQTPESDTYDNSSSLVNGHCLVINIETYTDDSRFPARPKQQQEAAKVAEHFQKLGFTVETHTNPNGIEFWKLIDSIATSQELSDLGSFVCFILGYGIGGSIFACDGDEIEVRDVVARFRANQCPALRSKPKVFFVQACKQQTEKLEVCSLEDSSFYIRDNDFLLCSGGAETNDKSLAEALCDVLHDEQFRQEHVESIVTKVNKQLGLPELKKGDERFGCSATAVSTLTKTFFLLSSDVLPSSPEKWSDQQLSKQCASVEKISMTFGTKDQTLLMIAAARGRDDLVSQMLQKKLQPSILGAQDVLGRTALCWAAHNGHEAVLKEFHNALENDAKALEAEVNRADNLRQTPIILAAKSHQTGVLELLVKMGAKLDWQDMMKFSAVIYAAKLGFSDTVHKLCDLGADLKLTDFSGNSPLIWAARCGHETVLLALGKRLGAVEDLEHWRKKGERGMNAKEWAKHCEHFQCAAFVEKSIRQLANLSDIAVNLEQSGDGNYGGTSGGQPPTGGPGGPSGGSQGSNNADREDGAVGGGGPEGGGNSQTNLPYPMHGSHRGIALVINILDFVGLDLKRREGSMVDMSEDNLYRCFTTLGFECRSVQNVNRKFFDQLPTNICSEEELRSSQAIIVCIMSHGGLDFIYAHNGLQTSLEQIYSRFRICKQLLGKPKIFFVQACRDGQGIVRRLEPIESGPLEDCMYFYSTSRGRLSSRDPLNGALFTRQLCEVVANDFQPDNEDFTDIVPKLVSRVTLISGGDQVPSCELTIRRSLSFPSLGMRPNRP